MKIFYFILLSFCSSIVTSQTPAWHWARVEGGTGNEFCGGSYYNSATIATDPFGNSYVAGLFNGSATFGTVNLVASGGPAIFVAKYDILGTCLWAQQFGAVDSDIYGNQGMSIDLDNSGNCYVTGLLHGPSSASYTLGSSTFTTNGMRQIFVAKLNAGGTPLWIKLPYQPGANNYASCIAADAAGNSYITGYLGSSGTAFGSTIIASYGAFAAKYDPNGNVLWALPIGASTDAIGIDADVAGNVYVTGYAQGTGTFNTIPVTTITPMGMRDVFVAKVSAMGSLQWVKNFGAPPVSSSGNNMAYGKGISTDLPGNVYVTGDFEERLIVGTSTLGSGTSMGGASAFVIKLDPAGLPMWSLSSVNSATNVNAMFRGTAIKTKPNGESYAAGYFYPPGIGSTSLCSIAFPKAGNQVLYVAKIDSLGGCAWAAFSSGQGHSAMPFGVSYDGADNVYVAGINQGAVSFGTNNLTAVGGIDFLIAKLGNNPVGTVGLKTIPQSDGLNLFPNPAQQQLHIQPGSIQNKMVFKLYDATGKLILTSVVEQQIETIVSLESVARGFYYFEVLSEGVKLKSGKLAVE